MLAASSRVVVTLLGAAIQRYLEAPVGPLRLELVDDAAALELVRERRVDIAVVPIDAVPRGLDVDSVETAAHLAGLGVGVAVVDASTRLPAGVHARPLPELGCAEYRVIFRRELYIDSSAWVLRELLVTNAAAWKRAADVAWRRR